MGNQRRVSQRSQLHQPHPIGVCTYQPRGGLQGQARQQDTRRKILAGAMLLELMADDVDLQKKMMTKLSSFLTRPRSGRGLT